MGVAGGRESGKWTYERTWEQVGRTGGERGAHGGHVVCPLAMPGLQPLHRVQVVDDPHHITHPEAVMLGDRASGEVWLPGLRGRGTPTPQRQLRLPFLSAPPESPASPPLQSDR